MCDCRYRSYEFAIIKNIYPAEIFRGDFVDQLLLCSCVDVVIGLDRLRHFFS